MTPPGTRLAGRTVSGWARMAGVAIAVLALDQATKAIVRASLGRGETVEMGLGFEIVNVRNRGIAFGLLADGGALLLVVTAVTLVVLVGWFASDPSRPAHWLAVGLLSGGALGNLLDRLRDGEVTDFLDPPLWPAFNVADIAITAGMVALVALVLFADRADSPAAEP